MGQLECIHHEATLVPDLSILGHFALAQHVDKLLLPFFPGFGLGYICMIALRKTLVLVLVLLQRHGFLGHFHTDQPFHCQAHLPPVWPALAAAEPSSGKFL